MTQSCQDMKWIVLRNIEMYLHHVEILLNGPQETNFNEIFIEIYTFSFKKNYLKMSSGKWQPFGLILNVFIFEPPKGIP